MFEPKKPNHTIKGKEVRHQKIGYLGSSQLNISVKEDGLTMKTLQPIDKYKDRFHNPNEILIEVVAKFNDFDLPELAFVGLDSVSIKNKLGSPDYYKNNCFIYHYNNKALILKLKRK